MRAIATAATLSLVCYCAQAQDAQRAPPVVTSMENVESYVGYLRVAAMARSCGLRTAEWEKLRQAKLAELITRAVSKAPPAGAPLDGPSLVVGAEIAAGQEARSPAPAVCEALKPMVDELDAALPQDPSTQR